MSQATSSRMPQFLDPATSLAELLFGMIMTLTFTLGASIVIEDEGREGIRQLLIAVIGCNIAWGIIDGAMYIVNELFRRGRIRRLATAVRGAPDATSAAALVEAEFDGLLDDAIPPEQHDGVYARVANNLRSKSVPAGKVVMADFLGALACFLLVALTSVPAVIPFLLWDDLHVALRVSNVVLLGLLFIIGYWWARYTLGNPWLVGLCFLVGGTALVAVAIPLGG